MVMLMCWCRRLAGRCAVALRPFRVGDEDPVEAVEGESRWPADVDSADTAHRIVDELAEGRAADQVQRAPREQQAVKVRMLHAV